MSLRKIAKDLGISPAYLSYMVNGKRLWRQDLYERYCELVNRSVSNVPGRVRGVNPYDLDTKSEVVGGSGLEPLTSAMSTQYSNHLS